MAELLFSVGSMGSHLNLVLLFGVIILGGTFGSRLFQKFHIPQVVGCIVVGICLGGIYKVVTKESVEPLLEKLSPFTLFALGVIGFMIGSELRGDIFKRFGRQFFVILFSQGLGAFFLVFIGTSFLAYQIYRQVPKALALGLVFGAIASATAPAATANVLWEYKTRGPLTATILAIVALDDALALLLYRGAATGAKALLGTGRESVLGATVLLFGEILGAITLGFMAGVLLYLLLRFVKADDKILGFSVSSLLIVVGVSIIPGIDPILPAMTFGITIANLSPRRSKNTFSLIENFSPPLYTAFFVLAGAHMRFSMLTGWMIVMIIVYVLCRAFGKIAGSWFGAHLSGAAATVRKYLGICLLPQAGVAIGLAILASQQLGGEFSDLIIMVTMTGTFLMEIIGPMMVKVGVKKAGEVGLNITEEDLVKTYQVKDVMDTQPVTISQDTPLHEILEIFSRTEVVCYPVVDNDMRIVGIITVAGIKEMFANQDVAGWLLACDVAEPVKDVTFPAEPLEDVVEHMRRYNVESMPVISPHEHEKLAGMLDLPRTMRRISAEVLHRRQRADGMQLAGL